MRRVGDGKANLSREGRRRDGPRPIDRAILLIRGREVMLDRELAILYGVKPIALRQQVRRNPDRFPPDFMFQLSFREVGGLLSHNVIPSRQHLGGFRPLAFTEQGVAMLSSVLRSRRAIRVNIEIMRAFVRLRRYLATHKDLALKMAELERRVGTHEGQIRTVFEAIRELMASPEPPKRRIGFYVPGRTHV